MNLTTNMIRMLPKTVQIVLFSATFPPKVVQYAEKFAPAANQLTLAHEELTVEGIKQFYVDCNGEQEKFEILVKLYGLMTIGSSVIFVKVSVIIQKIVQCLNNLVSVVILQSRLSAV